MSPPRTLLLASVFLLPLLSSCDQIAVLDGTRAREADAVAVGSACRHAGRALEDCFNMNPDAPKAQVFAGWKEMNDYMTEKKIDVIAPTPVKPAVKPAPKAAAPEIKTGATEGKAAGKTEGPPRRLVCICTNLGLMEKNFGGATAPRQGRYKCRTSKGVLIVPSRSICSTAMERCFSPPVPAL